MTNPGFYSDDEIAKIKKELDIGYLVPVKVHGGRMSPMLKEGREEAVLFKLFAAPERGSIVLCSAGDGYFLSRVYRVKDGICTVMCDRDRISYDVKLCDCIAEVKAIDREGKRRQGGIVWWYFGSARVLLREIFTEAVKIFYFKKLK